MSDRGKTDHRPRTIGGLGSSSSSSLIGSPAPPPKSSGLRSPSPSSARSPQSTTPPPTATTTGTTTNKCAICQIRQARDGCPLTACLACCTIDECIVHQKSKEKAHFRSQVLSSTTLAQQLWRQVQAQSVSKKRFREPAFQHVSDTLTIWNVRQFLLVDERPGRERNGDPTLERHHRDDAIRKSLRRRSRGTTTTTTTTTTAAAHRSSLPRSSRTERFHRLLEERLATRAGSNSEQT